MFSWLPTPTATHVLVAGFLVFALTVLQMLIGYRKIRFKGRTHLKVHKAAAWVLLVGGLVHGFAALLFFGVVG